MARVWVLNFGTTGGRVGIIFGTEGYIPREARRQRGCGRLSDNVNVRLPYVLSWDGLSSVR